MYLQKYPMPKMQGTTNRDLLNWALDLKDLNNKHNEDKEALIKWTKEVEQ